MSAASNSAIKSFLDQRAGDLGASSLSTLVQAVQDPSTAADLAGNPQNAALLKEVLSRLIAVANDGAKGTAVRLMCLEALYHISAGATDAVRQGPLFLHVQQLNQSFDDMMEREAAQLSTQKEMLAVLLLRCTGYTKLKAGDVLQQLCGNDEGALVALLISMLQNASYEWPLVQAALRWLYELTTPATYFTADTATETTKVHAFQAKVGVLLGYINTHSALAQVFAQLTAIWQRPATQTLLGGLAKCESISSVSVLSSSQERELLQWAVVLRYLSVFVHNLSEFSDQPRAARTLQERLVAQSQDFLATVLIPFAMASVTAWERNRGAGVAAQDGPSDTHNQTRDPFLNAAIAALRLLRFSLYRPATSAAATTGDAALLHPPLLTTLQHLFQQLARLEPVLKAEYAGMLVLLMGVQCGCNVNATKVRGTPVDLASFFEVLVATIANDKAPIRPDSAYPTALAFFICFQREDSPFAETQPHGNESVAMVLSKFDKEAAEIAEGEQTLEAIVAMHEQLEMLQAMIMEAAMGQLLAELAVVAERQEFFHGTASPDAGPNPLLLGRRPSNATPAESPSLHSKKKKAKHPPEYCCQLTGKLMREPVTIRQTGHHFEYDALMNVVNQMGHVDPLTGQDVNEEFEVDEALRQEIADYRVARAAKK